MFSCKLLNKAKNLFLTKLNYTEKKKQTNIEFTWNSDKHECKNIKKKKKKKQSDNIVKQSQKLDNLE